MQFGELCKTLSTEFYPNFRVITVILGYDCGKNFSMANAVFPDGSLQ